MGKKIKRKRRHGKEVTTNRISSWGHASKKQKRDRRQRHPHSQRLGFPW